jgi:FdhD protein
MVAMLQSDSSLRRNVTSTRVLSVRNRAPVERPDRLAAEEPMEIRAGGPAQEPVSVAVTLRTPGNDFELAAGFLYTEGLIHSRDEIATVEYCRDLGPQEQLYNVVTVSLVHPFDPGVFQRNFYATSSCGVCGKASLEQVQVRCAPIAPGPVIAGSIVPSLPETLRSTQRIFDQTGGLHAAGLFDVEGRLSLVREDIGRHNAVDKLIGERLLGSGLPLSSNVLLVSGRISFEIVQKAAVAGIPILCAVSAPSNLAVETAAEVGMTLVGFVRDGGFNVYSHPERIDVAA